MKGFFSRFKAIILTLVVFLLSSLIFRFAAEKDKQIKVADYSALFGAKEAYGDAINLGPGGGGPGNACSTGTACGTASACSCGSSCASDK